MTPAFKAITFRRGDTPALGVILHGRNIRTEEIRRLPIEGSVVSWTIGWPSGSVTKTTAVGGGLATDPRTGAITWPVTLADLATVPVEQVIPYAVQLVESDGRITTYLTGTIHVEGSTT